MKMYLSAVKKMCMVLAAAALMFTAVPLTQTHIHEHGNNYIEIMPFDEFPAEGGDGKGDGGGRP